MKQLREPDLRRRARTLTFVKRNTDSGNLYVVWSGKYFSQLGVYFFDPLAFPKH